VIKTRRNDRIIKVERRTLIGDAWRFEETLRDSEDSLKLNTSFVERLNLTIRQGSAFLSRRTICQARWNECLEDHLELLRCHYQLCQASYGVEVRTRDEDAGDPGWTDDAAAELKKNLLVANCFFGSGEGHICIRSLQHLVHCRGYATPNVGLATLDGGSHQP
jgi:hypothetical protein